MEAARFGWQVFLLSISERRVQFAVSEAVRSADVMTTKTRCTNGKEICCKRSRSLEAAKLHFITTDVKLVNIWSFPFRARVNDVGRCILFLEQICFLFFGDKRLNKGISTLCHGM